MKKQVFVLMLAIFAMVMSGCMIKGKVTGGGWVPGLDGGKANFGFNAAQCERGLIEGHFNYHDKKADPSVKMNGEVTFAVECGPEGVSDVECATDCAISEALYQPDCRTYQVEFDYDSKDRKQPGSGDGIACLVDCGEGSNTVEFGDQLFIRVLSGPFADYSHGYAAVTGNMQAHTCTCTDGIDNDGDGFTDDADVDCTDANGDEDIPQI